MYTKAEIFNLALSALLLQREISDPTTNKSNENKVLLTNWEPAFYSTLIDLDLDSTSTQKTLELIEEDPNDGDLWAYAYKYPSDCLNLRRIQSCRRIDGRYTHIQKRVAIHEGQKAIFTDQEDAIVEYIPNDVPLTSLAAPVGLCIAYRLASLSSALIVGKGAQKLRAEVLEKYVLWKAEAQEHDKNENFVINDEWEESEFVNERMS